MFEIGKTLREARESMGINILEASNDLEIKEVILENIEEGSIGCFKDIYELKEYISNYAKYLGLDSNKIIDDFNEYMFEYTSKIPVKEIEKQVALQSKEKQSDVVVSPYTKPNKKYPVKYYTLFYCFLILIFIGIIIWSVSIISE